MEICHNCQKVQAEYNCDICQRLFCQQCDLFTHSFSSKKRHIRTKLLHNKVPIKSYETANNKYTTDKNGFYKVANLVKGENYTVTVISGNQSYNLYPKVKVYKKISENLTNQNFYIVQDHTKILEKPRETNKKDSASEQEKEKKSGEWYDDYGLQKKNGMLQKQI